MSENGIDEFAAIARVTMEGAQFGISIGKGGVKLMKRTVLLFGNMIQHAKYHKTEGWTNMKNVLERSGGNLVSYSLDKAEFNQMKKLMNKNGILYTTTPNFRECKNKDRVHITMGKEYAPRMADVMNRQMVHSVKKSVKAGMSKDKATAEWMKKNSIETLEEMMHEIGAMSPEKDFDAEMKQMFGDNYKSVVEKFDVKKNSDQALDMQAALNEIMLEYRKNERKEENAKQQSPVKYHFEENHIVEQTETFVKIQINEHEKPCVWLPKERIEPPLDIAASGGVRIATMSSDMPVLLQDIEGKDIAYKLTASEFDEKMKMREKEAFNKLYGSKKSKSKSIGKSRQARRRLL